MGNNRVFDYTEINRIYGEMNTIAGDASDPTSIVGILHEIDKLYTELVNGSADENTIAIKGECAADLKQSWDNVVGKHFPAFVENFSAWSTVVAQTAGDYSKFEQEVRGIRNANPLGWNSGGITDSHSATDAFYSTAMTDAELQQVRNQIQFHQLTGATYCDTGMTSYLTKGTVIQVVGDILDVGATVGLGYLGMGAGLAISNIGPLASSIGAGVAGVGVGGALGAATGKAGIFNTIGNAAFGYKKDKYMTGDYNVPLKPGETKDINGTTYTFVGSSTAGTNIYRDANDQLVYYDQTTGTVGTIVDANGQPVTYNDKGNIVLNAGNEVVGPQSHLNGESALEGVIDFNTYDTTLDTVQDEVSKWV